MINWASYSPILAPSGAGLVTTASAIRFPSLGPLPISSSALNPSLGNFISSNSISSVCQTRPAEALISCPAPGLVGTFGVIENKLYFGFFSISKSDESIGA